MSPLEQLLTLEIEYQRRLRQEAPGIVDASALHTSYALQRGYEPILRQVGHVTGQQVEQVTQRLMGSGDSRDVTKARDSILGVLGL